MLKTHLFACTLALATLTATVSAQTPVTLYGVNTYDTNQNMSGVYTVEAVENAQPELYWGNSEMLGNGGAVYDNEKLYILSYLNFNDMLIWWYLICDIEAQTHTCIYPDDFGIADAGSAQTYDPTTGTAYSICLNADDPTKFTLSTINLADGAKKKVADIEQQLVAMSFTANGILYGIGVDGNLYTVDKTDASLTLIGATGIHPKSSNQSAAIDYETNVMYWSSYTDDGGVLYSVDLTSGQATLLSKYDDSHQFVGLFIKQSTKKAGAPEAATNLDISFDKATTNGSITFTAPTLDTNGTDLSGELTYQVKLNDDILTKGFTQPGHSTEAKFTSPVTGNCIFTVITANDFGHSLPANVSTWVGMDTPLKVENCVLTNDNSTLTLSWTLPEKGINGGYVDPELTRYIIDRGPYDTNVAEAHEGTTFTEKLDFTGVNPVLYRITPFVDDKVGEPELSNSILVGEYMEPPFAEDFTDPFRSMVFKTITSYNPDDVAGWMYNFDAGMIICEWPWSSNDHDAWFISAPILLEADKYYQVKTTLRSEGMYNHDTQEYDDVYAGVLSLHLGSEPTVESMATGIIAPFEITCKDFKVYESDKFTVQSTGTYHIGYHMSGRRSIYYAFLQRLEVEPVDGSGIADANAESKFAVQLSGNLLAIDNPSCCNVSVTAIDGRTITTTSDAHATVNLAPGIYIASDGCRSAKIAVK